MKEISFYTCNKCDYGCIYSFGLGNTKWSPRKPKGCILNRNAEWELAHHQINLEQIKIKYFCEVCNFLCCIAPLSHFSELPTKCLMFNRHHDIKIKRYKHYLKKYEDDFWAQQIIDEKNEKRKDDPIPVWRKH